VRALNMRAGHGASRSQAPERVHKQGGSAANSAIGSTSLTNGMGLAFVRGRTGVPVSGARERLLQRGAAAGSHPGWE